MKQLITIIFIALCLTSFGQQKRFTIQAKVVDEKGVAISDVYIVNLVSNEKDISKNNGIFTIQVLPTDSIVLSHISYFRKIVSVYSLLLHPTVQLYSENVNIPEVKITPDKQSDYDRAMANLEFLNVFKVPEYTKIKEENEPVTTIMTEHNDLMRSEASSISLIRISPTATIGRMIDKLKKKENSKEYSSTKKQLKDIVTED